MASVSEWMSEKSSSEWWVYVKRLSANDTGLTGGHQVGVYIPKEVLAHVFPALNRTDILNPDHHLKACVKSHSLPEQTLRAIYYNGKFHGKTRDEKRITRWNSDVNGSPLQDHENTGGLAIFAFHAPDTRVNSEYLDVWVCNGLEEETVVESQIGEIFPGQWAFERGDLLFGGFVPGFAAKASEIKLPEAWLNSFPSGEELINYLTTAFRFKKTTPDDLIIERRDAEYSLFRQVEEHHVLDDVKKGFESVDDFIKLANSVSNRRKSRSGRSLELHLEHLFIQFGLTRFGTQCVTEGKKKPDFLFPSCAAYHDADYPEENLRMLAVKTTCKDRWRQVLNEADRIGQIHLFTLQEGVSQHQFDEMEREKVTLVVPEPLHKKYPEAVRGKLMSLDQFISQTRNIYL